MAKETESYRKVKGKRKPVRRHKMSRRQDISPDVDVRSLDIPVPEVDAEAEFAQLPISIDKSLLIGQLPVEKHEVFAQGLAMGYTALKAYRRAGYGGTDHGASKLLSRCPEIRARAKELAHLGKRVLPTIKRIAATVSEPVAQAVVKVDITREWLMQQGALIIEEQRRSNPAVALRAIELLGREYGLFIERKIHGVTSIDDMTEAQLEVFLGQTAAPTIDSQAAGAGAP